ncbi:hypothetical protein NE237_023871 [Protea cynaroides]|uniref:Uncharacterized protein n=1 Tax=Protea cynaroides TaxID=273540 RepID=A0A9Q0K5T6_9MAGN|nr:hypothetical protein NE237_023871 [Protea cynaroides]
MVAQSMPDSTLLSQGAIGVVRTSGRLLRPTCGALTVKRKPEFQNFKTEVRRMMSEMGYDFSNPCVLGKGEGILAPLESVTRKVMESTWFTTDQGLHNFTGLGYQPTHSDMISSESEGSSFFENGTYEDNVQSHVISIVHAQDIEDPNGAFFTVPAKNKNDEILFYRGPYLPPPPPGPIVSDGVPNVETFNDTVKTMMRKMGIEDWLEDRRLGLSPHGLGYLPLDLSSPKKYEEETDRESSYTESWDSNSCIPDLFPLAVNCTTAKPSTPPGNEERLIERQNQTLVGELQERWPIDEPQPLTESRSQLKWPCRSAQRIIVDTIARTVEEDGQEIMTWEDDPSEEPRENLKPVPPTDDEVRQVDLGTEGDPRPIFLSASLSSEEAEQYVQLLKEYLDIFAWSYAEMPGLDPEIAVHRQHIKPDAKPFKQAQRRFHPLLMEKIDKKVQKLKDVGFIREEKDPDCNLKLEIVETLF